MASRAALVALSQLPTILSLTWPPIFAKLSIVVFHALRPLQHPLIQVSETLLVARFLIFHTKPTHGSGFMKLKHDAFSLAAGSMSVRCRVCLISFLTKQADPNQINQLVRS